MSGSQSENNANSLLGAKQIRIALKVILAIFVFFIIWAFIFPIESASIAQGKVALSSTSKKIQSAQSGRVEILYVKEGDRVEKGSPLLTIDISTEKQQRDLVAKRLNILSIIKERLEAQIQDSDKFLKLDQLLEGSVLNDAQEYLDIEIKLLSNSIELHQSRISLLEQRVANLAATAEELQDQVFWMNEQKVIADQEIVELESLLDRGLVGKTRLLALKRESARLQSEKERLEVSISSTKKESDEALLTINSTEEEYRTNILEGLQNIESKIIEEEQNLNIYQTVIDESVVTAPISGVIYGLAVYEAGEVLQAGQLIANIIPEGGHLTLEAYIRPIDIEMIKVGQKSNVVLQPFNPRRMQSIQGTVSYISPNTIFNEKLRAEFYIAYIIIDESELKLLGIKPLPGMPAEVVIISDKRTLFQYIYDPIYQSFYRSFREK